MGQNSCSWFRVENLKISYPKRLISCVKFWKYKIPYCILQIFTVYLIALKTTLVKIFPSFTIRLQWESTSWSPVLHATNYARLSLKISLNAFITADKWFLYFFYHKNSDWKKRKLLLDKNQFQIVTKHVFVKHGCPQRQQSQNMIKYLSPTFWPYPTPGACDISEVWATLRWTSSPSLVTLSPSKR